MSTGRREWGHRPSCWIPIWFWIVCFLYLRPNMIVLYVVFRKSKRGNIHRRAERECGRRWWSWWKFPLGLTIYSFLLHLRCLMTETYLYVFVSRSEWNLRANRGGGSDTGWSERKEKWGRRPQLREKQVRREFLEIGPRVGGARSQDNLELVV